MHFFHHFASGNVLRLLYPTLPLTRRRPLVCSNLSLVIGILACYLNGERNHETHLLYSCVNRRVDWCPICICRIVWRRIFRDSRSSVCSSRRRVCRDSLLHHSIHSTVDGEHGHICPSTDSEKPCRNPKRYSSHRSRHAARRIASDKGHRTANNGVTKSISSREL